MANNTELKTMSRKLASNNLNTSSNGTTV